LFVETNDVEFISAHPGIQYDMANLCFKDIPLYSSVNVAKEKHPNATVLKMDAGQAADISYRQHSENPEQTQWHISQAYAALLGLVSNDLAPPKELKTVAQADARYFAISPFSRSCSRHSGKVPNKTLDSWKWEYIIRYLRRQGLPVKVVAGPNDNLEKCSVSANDYYTAKSWTDFQEFFSHCAMLVTVDNGIGHIASVLDVPTISLWPQVSNLAFIAPLYGKQVTYLQIGDPNQATPAQMLTGIRKFTKLHLSRTIC